MHVHAGYVASAYLLATYLLSMRNSVLTFLLGLSHERAVRWHAACAVLATAVTLQHGLVEHLADPEYMHRVGKSMGFITGGLRRRWEGAKSSMRAGSRSGWENGLQRSCLGAVGVCGVVTVMERGFDGL